MILFEDFYGCPYNFLHAEPDYYFIAILIGYVASLVVLDYSFILDLTLTKINSKKKKNEDGWLCRLR
jgi:hypothetical protein